MTIPEAVQLVMQAGELGRGGEVFVLDMGEPARMLYWRIQHRERIFATNCTNKTRIIRLGIEALEV